MYNRELITILRDNGFLIVSGELFDESLAWIPKGGKMNYMPETLGHLMAEKGIWEAARNSIFGSKEKDAVCVVMFHKYDLSDEDTWSVLENLLNDCKADQNVELYTFSSLYESGESMDYTRYKANLLSNGLAKYVLPHGVMYPTWICYMVHAVNAILYALVAMAGFIVLCAKTKRGRKGYAVAIMLITGGMIWCAAWWYWTSPFRLLVLVIFLCIIPLFVAIAKVKEQDK